MALYIRKSLSVGPLRFNLSQNGVGVSAGVPGFRVGKNARGNYVHIGRGGIYYRSSLPVPATAPPASKPTGGPPPPGAEPLTEIESGSVLAMVDTDSKALLDDIRARKAKLPLWPWLASCWLVLGALTPPPYGAIALGVLAPLVWWAWLWDKGRRTAVLFYDFEEGQTQPFEGLNAAVERLGQCGGLWHLSASGRVRDSKYHGGATQVVRRHSIRVTSEPPSGLVVNVPVFGLPVGRQRLYFLPDRVLVIDGREVGAVSYSRLSLDVSSTRFVEDGSVPPDAKVVDRTWKYVNRNGGPDRRFSNNRELPVALYEDLEFKSDTGLNEVVQCSRVGPGGDLRASIKAAARSRAAAGV